MACSSTCRFSPGVCYKQYFDSWLYFNVQGLRVFILTDLLFLSELIGRGWARTWVHLNAGIVVRDLTSYLTWHFRFQLAPWLILTGNRNIGFINENQSRGDGSTPRAEPLCTRYNSVDNVQYREYWCKSWNWQILQEQTGGYLKIKVFELWNKL